MLTRIYIENFRGIKKLEISQDLTGVTVLLGPNSSGKTTVLHAIRLACQVIELALASNETAGVVSGRIALARDTLIESPAQLLPLADWQALFVDQSVNAGTKATISLVFSADSAIRSVDLTLSYARNNQLKFSLTVDAPDAVALVASLPKKSKKIGTTLAAWIKSHAPRAVFIPPFYGVVKDEEYRPRVVVDRLVGSGDQSHVVRNLVTGLTPQQLERLNAFLTESVGASISYRTNGDDVQTESPLRVAFQDSNGPIEISAAGAGLVNLIALYASLARWQSAAKSSLVMFLLDEPEAHLHPRLQGEVAQRMAALVTQDFGAQLFMATHSVEIINQLGQLDGTRLLRTDRAASSAITVLDNYSKVVKDLSQWVDLTPFTAINFMASRRVLFHEGSTDAVILNRCAELRFRHQAEKMRAFRRWTFVSLDGADNVNQVHLLQRLFKSHIWAAPIDAEAFKIVTVLDRDHQRDPGWTFSERGVLPAAATVVWGGYSIESVFLVEKVLRYWVRTFVPEAKSESLERAIAKALAQADENVDLNTKARELLTLHFLRQDLKDSNDVVLKKNTDKHAILAMRSAGEYMEKQSPTEYQLGKDRAKAVLGAMWEHLSPAKQGNFPLALSKLLSGANLDAVSNPVEAVPPEVLKLLDWMVEEAR
jgi:AAA ATPase domain